MSRDLSDEVSWFLSTLSLSQSTDREKQFITNLLSKKKCINKSVPRISKIWCTGFLKSKTNFLPTMLTISFIRNKTRYGYFKWGAVDENSFANFKIFERNFNSSLIQKKCIEVGLLS